MKIITTSTIAVFLAIALAVQGAPTKQERNVQEHPEERIDDESYGDIDWEEGVNDDIAEDGGIRDRRDADQNNGWDSEDAVDQGDISDLQLDGDGDSNNEDVGDLDAVEDAGVDDIGDRRKRLVTPKKLDYTVGYNGGHTSSISRHGAKSFHNYRPKYGNLRGKYVNYIRHGYGYGRNNQPSGVKYVSGRRSYGYGRRNHPSGVKYVYGRRGYGYGNKNKAYGRSNNKGYYYH